MARDSRPAPVAGLDIAEAEDRISSRGAWIRGGPYIRCWWCLARHDNARKTVRKRDVCVVVRSKSGCVGPLEVVSVARHANDDKLKPPARVHACAGLVSCAHPGLFWDSRAFLM